MSTLEADAALLGIDTRQAEAIIVTVLTSDLNGPPLALEAQPVTDDLDRQPVIRSRSDPKGAAVTLDSADNTPALSGAVCWTEEKLWNLLDP